MSVMTHEAKTIRSQTDGSDGSPAAEASDVTKVYGEGQTAVHALAGVSVTFDDGQFTAIMGPSGSGKSTLLQCLAGLDRVTSGEVRIGGVPISTLSEHDLTVIRRDRIGFVFQAFNLLPMLTASENIVLPLSLARRSPDPEWFDTVVDAVGIRDRLGHLPSELSGGQQQRVAVARALVTRPAIVFADEPTGNLDSHASAEVLGFLRRSVDQFGQSIVMVTHDPVAASYADRVVFLADGRIVDDIAPKSAGDVIARIKKVEAR